MADRCDPGLLPVLGDELTDQRCSGSHSRAKKLVAALRISNVALQLGVLALELPQLPRGLARHTGRLASVHLSLAQPLAQRLGGHPQPGRDGLDRRILRLVVTLVLLNQPDRLRPGLPVEPAAHRAILPNLGGVHETRGGSQDAAAQRLDRPRGSPHPKVTLRSPRRIGACATAHRLHAADQPVGSCRDPVAANDPVGRWDRKHRREDAGREDVDVRRNEEDRAALSHVQSSIPPLADHLSR